MGGWPVAVLQQAAAPVFGAESLALDLARSLLALGFVCALAFVSLRWLGRRGFGRTLGTGAAGVQVIARVGLEPRKSLYLVRAGKRVLLIGTGEAGPPSLIAELDPEAFDAPSAVRADPGGPRG